MPEFGHVNTVLFDLDGTLLNSAEAHMRAYEIMLPQFGIHLTRAEFMQKYTPDWLAMYARLGIPESEWNAADKAWLAAAHAQPIELFPDVVDALAALRSRYKLGIVTAGDRPRVESDLEQVGLASEISVVVTKDDVQRPKPHPEGLLSALSQLDSHVQEAMYVGDTVVDYHTARNAPMPFVGKRSDFGAAWPDEVAQVDHIHQVVELLLG